MTDQKLDQPMLKVQDLTTAFYIDGKYYNAINDIDLNVKRDEIVAIVGESGCGKSTLATSIMGLHDPNLSKTSGQITFEDQENLLSLSEKQYDQIRGKRLGMIFQDPLSSLDPLKKIADQISETLYYHTDLNAKQRYDRSVKLLGEVGIHNPEVIANEFPHQLSGGMRQRVMISMAIACNPDLIIADEPTTALDVTIQAQILDLLKDIQEKYHVGIILITHDLGVVAEVADRVAVMYAGQIVEVSDVKTIFNHPLHPYTRSLLRSIPQLDSNSDELYVIQGQVPSLVNMPEHGDRFAPRIPWIPASDHEADPTMHLVDGDHYVRCTCYKHFYFPDQKGEGNK